MPKNIVFCADGTWNSPQHDDNSDHFPDPSNVYKLFLGLEGELATESLRAADEQEKVSVINGDMLQTAKYIHGVGDSWNPLVRFMGGAFGAGIITRIVRGYTFISRNYDLGDKIYITGFSRGAYTARALAGFILSQGLLRKGLTKNKEEAYRKGAEAWYRYRGRYHTSHGSKELLARLAEIAAYLPAFLTSDTLHDSDFVPVDRIAAVAVWDTVGAMGIPDFDGDKRLDTFRFADITLSDRVSRGFHALSLDERRSDFTPTLWNDRPGIKQILFPGAHGDVGGGYPAANHESELSDGALEWMIDELQTAGVRFHGNCRLPLKPDAGGTAHQPWRNPVWKTVDQRDFPQAVIGHCSIGIRAGRGKVQADPQEEQERYAPPNLPGCICTQPHAVMVAGFPGDTLCARCRVM